MSVLVESELIVNTRKERAFTGASCVEFFKNISGLLLISVVLVCAIHFTSGYVLNSYETSMIVRASVPSVGLFQIANILFWSVLAACFL